MADGSGTPSLPSLIAAATGATSPSGTAAATLPSLTAAATGFDVTPVSGTIVFNVELIGLISVSATKSIPVELIGLSAVSGTKVIPVELIAAEGIAGIPDSDFLLTDFPIAERIRAELYSWSSLLSGGKPQSVEQIGAKVGSGPILTVDDFEFDNPLNAVGTWSLKVAVTDPGIEPIFTRQARVIKVFYENVGKVFTGLIAGYTSAGNEYITIRGYNLAELLTRRTAMLRFQIHNGFSGATAAYNAAVSWLTNFSLTTQTQAIAYDHNLPHRRFSQQTFLEILNDLNQITGANWRMDPVEPVLTYGDFGDDSGIMAVQLLQDDSEALRQGRFLAITDIQYEESDDEIVNMVLPEGMNDSFGTAMELRHAYERRTLVGNTVPIGNTLHMFTGSGTAPNVDPDWRIGSAPDRVGIAQKFEFAEDTEIAFVAVRIGGPHHGATAPNIAMQIYEDDGTGLPDEANPVASVRIQGNALFQDFSIPERTGAVGRLELNYWFNESVFPAERFPILLAATPYWVSFRVYNQPFNLPAEDWSQAAIMPFAALDDGVIYTDGEVALRDDAGVWRKDAETESYSMVFEISGKAVGSELPYIVEGVFADAAYTTVESPDTGEDGERLPDVINPVGQRVFFIRDMESISEPCAEFPNGLGHGQRDRMIPFTAAKDTREGLEDVFPGSDILYDAAAVYLSRHRDTFRRLNISVVRAFRLPLPGQKIRVVYRDWAERFDGTRVWLDINELFWVLNVSYHFTKQGIVHNLRLATIPEDLLDADAAMEHAIRRIDNMNTFFGELEFSQNSGTGSYVSQEPL